MPDTNKPSSNPTNLDKSYPLLKTKLYIPPLQNTWINRTKLIDKLDKGQTCKLILVSAPAGFGKTTLISEWIHHDHQTAAWFSIDKGDNDPVHFLIYTVAALQSVNPNIGRAALNMLIAPQLPPLESIVSNIINDIMALNEDIFLVLDDYHLIDSKPIHALLGFLIEHLLIIGNLIP